MDVNKNDRRVRKTKKAFRDALAELMMEKELRNITVQELADRADIHRATFYTHYKDIYDLYEQLENIVVKELSEILVCDPSHTYEGLFKILIDYVYDNGQICHMLLDKNGKHSFNERLSTFLEERYLKICQYEIGEKEITEELRFLIRYHLQGCISIVTRWAENGYVYSKDKLTNMLLKLDTNFDRMF